MPFRLKLKKSKHYSVVSKSLCVIAVKLLENATVECIVSSRTAGRECLQNVCQRLQITQPEYFGLRYQTRDGQLRWVDLERPLKKQLDKHGAAPSSREGGGGGGGCCSLQLGVMFYVPDAAQARRLLQSDVTRYYYFSQLKSDVIEGKLPCDRREAIRLASYSLQAEFGDHRPEHHTAEYLRNFVLFPKSVLLACANEEEEAALLDEIVNAHRSLQGLDHATAEMHYIQTVQRLEGYGEERFEVRNPSSGVDMVLGVSVQGVTARRVRRSGDQDNSLGTVHLSPGEEQQPQLAVYQWSEIVDLIHHKRNFKIVGRDAAHSSQFQLEDVSTAKYIWKMCVQQHGFFMSMQESAAAAPGGMMGETYTRAPSINIGGGESFRWTSLPDTENTGEERGTDVGESRESLDELAVYHTETRNSENYAFAGSTSELVDPNHNGYDHHPTNPVPVCENVAASTEHISMRNETGQQANSVHHSYVSLPRSSESATDLRRALLPSYRQAPDYETAVLNKYGVTSCSLNDLPLETQQNSQVYHQQHPATASAVSNELDISLSRSCNPLLPPLSYTHYGNFADLTELGDSMSFGDLANNNNNRIDGIAHGRAPPLLAPPLHTYSTPELTSQGLSYEVNPAQLFANMHLNYQYKPPPPYPYGQRPSASTPDLTRNHHQLRASASPDLVSRRHLSQSTIQGSEPSLPHYQAAVNGNVTSETLRSIVEPPRPVLPTYVPVGESWNAQVSGVAQPQRIQVCVSTPTTREQVVAAMAKPIDSTPVPPPRKQVTEEKRAPLSQEASPAHPLGPMMVAAMNGLTLTVAQPDQLLTGDQDSVDQESPSPSTSKELRPEQILESRLEDGQVFLEFERIAKRKPNADFTTALLSENTTRNRFSDVLPYEENRVRLTPTPDNRSGYINASHVSASVGDSQRFYIAAQGPTRETAKSFWQMVWENHVGVVVMLTETEDEHGREKCFQYWPTADGDDAALSFGEYRVARKGVVSSAVAVTTSLTLSKSQGVACSHRNVWHLRYTDWPDHGTPGDIQGFLGFMEEVDSVRRLASGDQRLLRTRNTPMVVHCTAGVGRSGVVILCDILLFCLDHNVPVDVPRALSSVRMQRMLSVQTLAQYKFVYHVLIRYLRNSRLI